MSRPTSVTIAGYNWEIEWLSRKDWLRAGYKAKNVGETDHLAMKIGVTVHAGSDTRYEREILMHELMHASAGMSGTSYVLEHVKRADVEEVFILGVSPTLLGVLIHNPKVARYLLGKS